MRCETKPRIRPPVTQGLLLTLERLQARQWHKEPKDRGGYCNASDPLAVDLPGGQGPL